MEEGEAVGSESARRRVVFCALVFPCAVLLLFVVCIFRPLLRSARVPPVLIDRLVGVVSQHDSAGTPPGSAREGMLTNISSGRHTPNTLTGNAGGEGASHLRAAFQSILRTVAENAAGVKRWRDTPDRWPRAWMHVCVANATVVGLTFYSSSYPNPDPQ